MKIKWPHNVDFYFEKLLNSASNKGFTTKVLGKTKKDYPIYFLDKGVNPGPHILVASGFHGNEPAGPWSIVKFLEDLVDDFISNVDISFIPLINPEGFKVNIRENGNGLDTNRGYMMPEVRNEVIKPITKEGQILKDYEHLIFGSSKDGLVCLHEAPALKDNFFVYSYEKSERPGEFSKLFRDLESKYFSIFPDGLTPRGLTVTNGIIWKLYDGAFQDWLFREGFTERAIVTETPKRIPFNHRVDANVKIIETFINYFKAKKGLV